VGGLKWYELKCFKSDQTESDKAEDRSRELGPFYSQNFFLKTSQARDSSRRYTQSDLPNDVMVGRN
jgi:hypothetical protein